MNFDAFKDPNQTFSIILFLQPADLDEKRPDLESLGKQRNVRLVIQPCPFEGIEFLYRVSAQLYGHQVSIDKDVFWQAIALKSNVPLDTLATISDHHHRYLCAILEQDTKKVTQEGKALESLAEPYSLPRS